MNNQTLARWQDALSKVQDAHNQAVVGELNEDRTALINVLDEMQSIAEEARGIL